MLSLVTLLVTLHTRPFMYFHNFTLEMLNESFVFLCAMTCYVFSPFVTDADWRIYGAYFIIIQLIVIVGANEMLMWHSIMWQIFWKMDQEEKVYAAVIQRSKTMIERQKKKEVEQENLTELHVINELSSEEAEPADESKGGLNDLEQLVAIGPV